jgi:hypothetical protein
MKFCHLDFEFHGVSERKLNLVSVSATTTVDAEPRATVTKWLYNQEGSPTWLGLRKAFKKLIDDDFIFVAYAAEAEARSLLTLFGEDRDWLHKFKMIDLYLEYRCLLNHNNALSYGEQYIDGKIITTKPPKPKWAQSFKKLGEEDDSSSKPSYSLASATYKLLGEVIDSKEKDEVRDIIISGNKESIEGSKDRILAYNESDIRYLHRLLRKIGGIYVNDKGLDKDKWIEWALKRGEYAVRTALMVEAGYPVNMDKIRNFMSNIDSILKSSVEDCIEVAPEVKPFRLDKKTGKYVACEKHIRAWVDQQAKPYWRVTDKGKKSLSKDAFKDWYSSDSPGFAGAYCRHLKTKQSLNGFLPGKTKGKKTFLDYVGKDNRVRPYFGIYGAQSSRSQPAATGFIPLKAHWMRNFIEANEGFALAQGDFSSEEFLVAAILSQDKKMMEAYASGDVYLSFAKATRLVPSSATKDSHKKMRDVCKSLVLGISYDMSAKGLAPRLTQSSGEEYTEAQAQSLIDKFYETYSDYKEWKESILQQYEENAKLFLSDGWVMWGDNRNSRSVGNFPTQGASSVIMRRAVALAQDAGLNVLMTVHDSLTIEYKSEDVGAVAMLKKCMVDAFEEVMSPYGMTIPVRVDLEAWSKDYKNGHPDLKDCTFSEENISAKGKLDLERYRKFFDQKVLTDIKTDSITDTRKDKNTAKHSNERETNGLQKSGNSENLFQVCRVQEGSNLSL